MKRSQVNAAIRRMEAMIAACGFALPPFCGWTAEAWADKGHEYDEIRDNMLGWDVTDYGEGDFAHMGFSLITLRNGNCKQKDRYPKPYAEKLLYLDESQYAPMHFHWGKMEDIVNRGGGNALIRVYNATADEAGFAPSDVQICGDGRRYTAPAGTQICLCPGESISIYPRVYHDFTVEKGTGPVLLGEVSMCNDDENDNRFYKPLGRFSTIEEDEAPYRLLCNEYPKAK